MYYTYTITSNQKKKPTTIPTNTNTIINLFEQLQTKPIPYPHQIFTNQNLHIHKIQIINFNINYTLTLYHSTIKSLTIKLTLHSLITNHNYPNKILTFKYKPNFTIQNLIINKHLNNILKINHHHHIIHTFHKLNPLSKQKQLKIYQNKHIQISTQHYTLINTLFTIPKT